MKRQILVNGGNQEYLLGIGTRDFFQLSNDTPLSELDGFLDKTAGQYRFITVSYDLKNILLPVPERSTASFPLLECWTAESVYRYSEKPVLLEGEETVLPTIGEHVQQSDWKWQPKMSKSEYLEKVTRIKQHIQQGDIYETNFCQQFFAEVSHFDVWHAFHTLHAQTNAPYATLLETEEFAIAGASPEMFLSRRGDTLVSRPIKGTAPRGQNQTEDDRNKKLLADSEKDRRENVMIVDLVRNDFSRIAEKKSVSVPELFGVHTFETVHQLISEVKCTVRKDIRFSQILEATFPMGSMTGAPKVAAVDVSDQLENFRRGIYSGSIGVVLPNGDFEMNVLIRSLVYEKAIQQVSCGVGGAITCASVAEEEYEECQTKVGKILSLFGTCNW